MFGGRRPQGWLLLNLAPRMSATADVFLFNASHIAKALSNRSEDTREGYITKEKAEIRN
jgi:hypothetical protein